MANQNYDQVAELYAQGNLSWEQDAIVAFLYTGEVFDPAAKTVADLTGQRKASQRIDGRFFIDGLALGLPAAFQKVGAGPEYQIIVAQDTGNNDPNLLSFIDANSDGTPITVQRTGTLIIRPVLPSVEVPDRPPTIGVWMRLPA